MNIQDIRDAINIGRHEISIHADEKIDNDLITIGDIFASVQDGEVIEDYPDDRPFPSCLIYGRAHGTEPLHSVWGYDEDERLAVLITVYRPDPDRWVEWRIRR